MAHNDQRVKADGKVKELSFFLKYFPQPLCKPNQISKLMPELGPKYLP